MDSLVRIAATREWLRRERYQILSLADLVTELGGGRPRRGRGVVITIDDGYEEVAELAAPVLAEFDAPATTFVVSGFQDGHCWLWWDQVEYAVAHAPTRRLEVEVGGEQLRLAWDDGAGAIAAAARLSERLQWVPDRVRQETMALVARRCETEIPSGAPEGFRPMSWDTIRRCAATGMTFGPHTVTHPILAAVDRAGREPGGQVPAGRFRGACLFHDGGSLQNARAAAARPGLRVASWLPGGIRSGRPVRLAPATAEAARPMKIHFCDLCNESVPQAALDSGSARLIKGRVICATCEAAMSHAAGHPVEPARPVQNVPQTQHAQPAPTPAPAEAPAAYERAGHDTAVLTAVSTQTSARSTGTATAQNQAPAATTAPAPAPSNAGLAWVAGLAIGFTGSAVAGALMTRRRLLRGSHPGALRRLTLGIVVSAVAVAGGLGPSLTAVMGSVRRTKADDCSMTAFQHRA